MADLRAAASEALIARVLERGQTMPPRPDAADLWDFCGGNGYTALLVMLDFLAIEQRAKELAAQVSRKDWLERLHLRDVDELVA